MRVLLATLTCVLATCSSAQADIVYEFRDETTTVGAGLDGQTTGSFLQGGVTMTATVALSTAGTFNGTGSFFGINQSAPGDDTDGFDFTETAGPGVAEGLTLSFDQTLQLEAIEVASFGGADEITITSGGSTIATITSTGSHSLGSFTLAADTDVEILTTAGSYGNGWSLVSFTVTPEPSGISLLAVGVLSTMVCGYRRKRSAVTVQQGA